MTKCLKADTRNTLPHGNASLVGGYPGTSGRMLSEWVGACSGIRTEQAEALEIARKYHL